MLFYKSCREIDGRFYSSDVGDLEYKLGEWTRPVIPGSKLFVLTHIPLWNIPVFQCKVENPVHYKHCLSTEDCDPGLIKKFWDSGHAFACHVDREDKVGWYWRAVEGMVCDAVKLVRRV